MSDMMQQYADQNSDGLHKWQLDMREELENFRLYLQGYEINPNFRNDGDDYYVKISDKPFCNKLGAIQIKNRMTGVVNKAASDTNLSQDKINREMEEFDKDISGWLAISHRDFGIKSRDYNAVCEMLVEFAINIRHRSIKGWKGGLINAPGNVKEVYYPGAAEQPQQQKKFGFFGR